MDEVITRVLIRLIDEASSRQFLTQKTYDALYNHVEYNTRLNNSAIAELTALLTSGKLRGPRVPYIYRGAGVQRLKFSGDIDVQQTSWQQLRITIPQMSWSLSEAVAADYIYVGSRWEVVYRARPLNNIGRLIAGINRLVDAPKQERDREVLAIAPIITSHVRITKGEIS